MARWINLSVDLLDAPFGVDQVADARRVLGVCGIGGTVDLTDGPRLVAQQVIGEIELDPEGQIFGRRIAADADDDRVARGEFRGSITEPLAFDGSAGGIGFGVPPKQ
jgi:hypothetical protein